MKERIKLMKKYFKKKKGVHLEEATNLINNDLNNALERAKTLIVTKDVSEPFVLRGPNLYNEDLKYRLNKDNKEDEFDVDYNNSLITIIFLGKTKLYYYQSEIDHVNGLVNEELSGEVKYSNILNTEFEIDNQVDQKYNPIISVVNLVLTLDNEAELVFNLRNHYEFNDEKYPNVLTDNEKYIAKTIKAAIEA